MVLSQQLRQLTTLTEKARAVWQHYENRRLCNALEPPWIHSAYELIRRFAQGHRLQNVEMDLVRQILESHELPDGYSVPAIPGLPGPGRIMHDGWKSGTPTWVFMGRALGGKVEALGGGWVLVGRTLPDEFYRLLKKDVGPTTFIAYHLQMPLGMTAMTANCIGPCDDEDVIRSYAAKAIAQENEEWQ